MAKARANSRKFRTEKPEQFRVAVRSATLKKKYGITQEDFEALLAAQDGRCAICRGTESKGNGRMHVDHCHKTGQIRGILCQACNVTLGKMQESPALLRAAADYLEKL